MPKVIEVIDPTFRSGEKNGKVWALSKVRTSDGKEATGFSLNVGDEVTLTYNEQYKNYSAEKMTAQKQEKAQLEDTLKTILGSLGRIERHLGINGALPAQSVPELPPVDVYTDDQEPDLGSIPF